MAEVDEDGGAARHGHALPAGLAVARDRRGRRGRVPDARGGPGGAGPRGRRGAGPVRDRPVPRRRARTRWCCRRLATMTRRPPHLRAARLPARPPQRDWSPTPGVELLASCYPSRPRKRDRSTTTRVTSPEPTSLPASVAATVKRTSRPSTWATEAVTATSRPTGLGARCSSVTRVPTLVVGPGQPVGQAAQVVASHQASRRGVPSTGRSPDPTRRRCRRRRRVKRLPGGEPGC